MLGGSGGGGEEGREAVRAAAERRALTSPAALGAALTHSTSWPPQMLIGHSFGGKVVLSMARQFAAPGTQLPRPVHVWVLDAPPGEARAGGGGGPGSAGGADHPARLIEALAAVPLPIAGRNELIDTLTRQGFSVEVARW